LKNKKLLGRGVAITEKEFALIKLLSKTPGISTKQITEVTGRSGFSVYYIAKAEDLAEYHLLTTARYRKYKVQPAEVKPMEVTPVDLSSEVRKSLDEKNTLTVQLRTIEYNQLQEINLLKEMRNLLAELVEKQAEQPKKKFW